MFVFSYCGGLSSGGHLCFSYFLNLGATDSKVPMPGGVFGIGPVLDLTTSTDSVKKCNDVLISAGVVRILEGVFFYDVYFPYILYIEKVSQKFVKHFSTSPEMVNYFWPNCTGGSVKIVFKNFSKS